MATSESHEQPESEFCDLNGLLILIVEDSWHVGKSLKMLLETKGANVLGPVATTADAECLIAERLPDAAIVDINLRHGERSDGLIDRLQNKGVRVVVLTGYADASLPPVKAAAILEKPARADALFASLCPGNARHDRKV